MKQLVFLLSITAFLFAPICSAGERMIATPAERLVGHWSTSAGDNLYYEKIKSDGIGSYILVQPDGNTVLHQYKVISQIPAGKRVIVQLIFADGDKRIETYMSSKNGRKLESTTKIFGMTVTSQLKYVDNKEKP